MLSIDSSHKGKSFLFLLVSLIIQDPLYSDFFLLLLLFHLTRMVPRFRKRGKSQELYKDRNTFGVPLLHNLRQSGQPLPQTILYAMRYLRKMAAEAVGIFRKPGVRSRILQLKRQNESEPGMLLW